MAIVGSESFDVTQIDPDSLVLTRADGVGESVTPLRRGHWHGVIIRDVTTPFDGELCDCHTLGRDGIDDLLLRFRRREMIDALELGSAESGDEIALTVSGVLMDGTEFNASDCILIIGRR